MQQRSQQPPRTWRGVGATTVNMPTASNSPSSMAPRPGGPQVGTLPTLDEMDPDPLGWHDPVNQRHLVETPPASRDSAGGRKYVDYRLDPAPAWGGDQPEKHFKEYHRNLLLWLVEAEARLLHNLLGSAS